MRFSCRFESKSTGEQRDLISALDTDEVAVVERVRRSDGDEIAQVNAMAMVLRSAYAELDPHDWHHLGPPALLN